MRVSVLIPTYNRAYIIRDALKSALNQSFRDFEIVIVDDGSTDDTCEIIKGLLNENVRYIRHEQNRGYSAACNTAIGAASGDFLGFLDSDDLWKPDYLMRQMGFIDRHPEVDAVFTDLEITDGCRTIPSLTRLMKRFASYLEGEPAGKEYVLTSRQMYLLLLEEIPIKPTALIARRSLYDRAGLLNEAWPSGTDWDLFLRFSRTACFGYVDSPLAVQKWSSDATHRKFWEKDKLFLLDIFLQEKRTAIGDKEAVRAINRGLLPHYRNLAHYYLNDGRRAKSIAVYVEGFRQTSDVGMLIRAGSALLPLLLRDILKKALRNLRSKEANLGGTSDHGSV